MTLSGVTADPGTGLAQAQATFSGVLEHIVPVSFFEAAAQNQALQVTFFAILFAVALSQVQGPARALMLSICESLTEVMFKFVGLVMTCAPIGIGAAIAVTVGQSGVGVLRHLGVLVLALYGSLIAFALVVVAAGRRAAVPGAGPALRAGGAGAVAHRLFHGVIRGGTATRAPEHGAPGRAASHRVVRLAGRYASTWTAPRSIWRWRRGSRPRPRGSTCRCASSC